MDKQDPDLVENALRNHGVSLNMQIFKKGQGPIIGWVYSMNDNTFIKKVT